MSDAIVEQTRRILDLLLDEEGDPHNPLECDSDSPDKDVILIALRLREFGDTYNDIIQREMKHFKRDLQCSFAVGQGCEMFSKIVNQLSENQILKRELSQMSSEMGLLKIVVVLGIQAAGDLPNMVPAIKNAMVDFLNTRLLSWIQKSGGWNALKIFREKGKEWEEPSKTMIPNIERSSAKQISGNHSNLEDFPRCWTISVLDHSHYSAKHPGPQKRICRSLSQLNHCKLNAPFVLGKGFEDIIRLGGAADSGCCGLGLQPGKLTYLQYLWENVIQKNKNS